MGSNNSQQQPVSQQGPPQQQWAHSFPRDPQQRQSHLKVLPDLDAGAKLRITNNGAILHSGGTISGRKGPEGPAQREGHNGVHRSRSVSSPHHPQFPPHRDPLHRSQTHLNLQPPGAFNLQAKRFGSEPDLRVAADEYNAGARHRISREKKKKTKAPAPPPGVDSSPESIRYGWGSQQQEPPIEPPRRLRLFKTRAESKQKPPRKEDFEDRRDSRYSRDDPPKHEIRTEVIEESYRKREDNYRKPSLERDSRNQERYNDNNLDRRYERNDRFSREEFLHQRSYQNPERSEDRRENFDIKPKPELRRQKSFEQSKSQEMYEREQKFERSMSQTRSKERGEGGVMIRGREREVEVRQPLRKSAPPNTANRGLSTNEFQEELKKATMMRQMSLNTERVRPVGSSDKLPTEEKKPVKNEKILPKVQKISKNKMTTMDLSKRDDFKEQYRSRAVNENNIKNNEIRERGQASGKESTPGQSPSRPHADDNWESAPIIKAIQDRPPKTFYFGMDKSDSRTESPTGKTEDAVDRFAASLMQRKGHKIPGSSESALSSEPEDDLHLLEGNTHGIDLQLRPTLPKKQLEIPRFSPAAAWRLLSSYEGHELHSSAIEEGPVLMEDRIERLSRPHNAGPSHDNKSGDSGISGDAGPPECSESPRTGTQIPPPPHVKSTRSRIPLATWTPQQDLGEESSSDGGLDSPQSALSKVPHATSSRGHVFSLSLPRENHLAGYSEKGKPSYNSLQKLRRSVSGALGGVLNGGQRPSDISARNSKSNGAGNWFLSRSAPTSLDNCQLSPAVDKGSDTPAISDPEEESRVLVPQRPFSYLSNHVMYLPEFSSNKLTDQKKEFKSKQKQNNKDVIERRYHKNIADSNRNIINYHNNDVIFNDNSRNNNLLNDSYNGEVQLRQKSVTLARDQKLLRTKSKDEISYRGRKLSAFSKSCENISAGLQDLQDPPTNSGKSADIKPRSKGRRFTFQSTVRQIERRRLADKLSKEAEEKEKQRLGELKAMQRVEEEFQRKRAREKASIRQQLRLYSLEETNCNSLPSEWGPMRAEPDGAVSSPAPSPTSPQSQLDSLNYKQLDKSNKNYDLSRKYSYEFEQNEQVNRKYSNSSNSKCDSDYNHKQSFKENKSGYHRESPRQERSTADKQTPYVAKLVEQRSSQRRGRERLPTTEILSEFRQPRREYLEYRGRGESPTMQKTIHPQVVCHIPPRSPQVYHNDSPTTPLSDNYRKEFARGRSVGSSDSELSLPSVSVSQRPQRSRSASPVLSKQDVNMKNAKDTKQGYKNNDETNNEQDFKLNKTTEADINDAIIIPTLKSRPSLGLGIAARPFAPPSGFRPIIFSPQAVE